MKDTDGGGGFVDAAVRSSHVAVRYVEPSSEGTRAVLGFDIMSDIVRAAGVEGANDASTAVLVGPIRLADSARPGLFVVQAVRDPDGGVVGYLSSGISLDDVVERLSALPNVDDIAIDLDGTPLVEDGHGAATSSFELAGRSFEVSASDSRRSNWLLPITLLAGTVLLGMSALVAVRRRAAARRLERRSAARTSLLADLAEELVVTNTTAAVLQVVADRAGDVVGAKFTNVGRRDESDPSKLLVLHDASMPGDLADRYLVQDVHDDLPLPQAARTGVAVFIADRAEYLQRYPEVMADVVAAGIHAVCCAPLSLGGDRSVGVIGFAFTHALDPRDRREIESAAALVSQMTGRAFERARAREVVQERVQRLSDFARALTTARSSVDVASSVERLLPPLLDVDSATVSSEIPTDDDQTRCYPPPIPDGDSLVLRHGSERVWSQIDETLAVTIVDLLSGALTRTRVYDHEHAVLRRLQETLLTVPPQIEGFDIAVGYRSAVEAIGMGGDWYSVIETADAVYVVIGDVAGHGPDAVALMAEVKTIMRHLLTNDTPLGDVIENAHQTLQRREAYASVAIARIDKLVDTVTYINAGHPPMLRFTSSRIDRLADVHRPWLGVECAAPTRPTTIPFVDGDLLLLYTDGLVEERGEIIDASITARFHGVDPLLGADAIVTELVSERIRQRGVRSVDDDIAVVAVIRSARRRG